MRSWTTIRVSALNGKTAEEVVAGACTVGEAEGKGA